MIANKNPLKRTPGRKRLIFQHAFILLFTLILCLLCKPAFSVDFITEEDFRADKSGFKDYPLKLLFKKLAESDGAEKREISNFIILKQVFDSDILEKGEGGAAEYEESFGIIKEISENRLRLWIPLTEKYVDYYVGIDRIPTEKSGEYKITEANIGEWASVVYSMDDRIYKIKIDFQLAPPSDLYVTREGDKNIVGWSRASSEKEPQGYKLFINDNLFGTVEGTSASVPREKGEVDQYYVKSIYKHGNALIESKASDVILDEITSNELRQQALAEELFEQVTASLNPQDYENAIKLLKDNRSLFSQNLDQGKNATAETLLSLFRDIEEGDDLIEKEPEIIRSIESAITLYRGAEQKAALLPPNIDLKFLTEMKIKEGLDQKQLLETKNKELWAEDIYNRIISSLTPEEYENAVELINDQKTLLTEYLDQEKKDIIKSLAYFFQDIEEGDGLRDIEPETMENLDSALALYKQAEEKAGSLPQDIDVLFITEMKVGDIISRKTSLEKRNKELLAGETYDRIISALTPEEYEQAGKLLYDNRELLEEYLDQNRKENTEVLLAFFKDIDEGDLIKNKAPQTMENLDSALASYRNAEIKAKSLPGDINVLFLSEMKIKDALDSKMLLETKNNKLLAEKTYESIIAGLVPEQYERAKKQLYDNIPLLEGYLEADDQKRNIKILDEFFKDIDEGDRLSVEQPESAEHMAMAIESYQKAEQTSKDLLPDIDIKFISEQKISSCLERKALLELKDKKLMAEETYGRILASFTPTKWVEGRRMLNENQQSISEYLDKEQKDVINGLLAFFEDIDEGDRISGEKPETKEKLDSALALYSQAGEKATALSEKVSIGFIPEQRIEEGLKRKAIIEERDKKLLARERYDQIISSLNPGEWENGKKLLFDNRRFMAEYLDDYLKESTERLVSFFEDIEEGDRLTNASGATETTLENALSLYKRAELTANDLPDPVDVLFIAQEKINDCENKKTVLAEARERELAVAREAATKEAAAREAEAKEAAIALKETSEKPGVRISGGTGEPEAEYDRDSMIELALKEFDEKNYPSAWSDFMKIFGAQINSIKKGGKDRVKGALGLPVSCRAEVFFLIELDDLKNNGGITEDSLQEIRDKIENREGLWVIVRDTSKTNKIRRAIVRFEIGSF